LAPKLKDEKTQTQGKFPENSRIFFRETQETGKFGAKSPFWPKNWKISENSSPKSVKNSRNRQFRKSYLAKKTPKKTPE